MSVVEDKVKNQQVVRSATKDVKKSVNLIVNSISPTAAPNTATSNVENERMLLLKRKNRKLIINFIF